MATSARIYDRRLLEAGEDEEPKEDEETSSSETEADEQQPKEDGNDAEAQDAVDDIDKPFSGLDLRRAHCFGLSSSSKQGWKAIAD